MCDPLQPLAARKMVVEKKPEPQHPDRTQALFVREHEFQRPDDVRRGGEEKLALGQRLLHESKLVEFEIAQTAVNELGGRRRRAAREIVLLDETNRETPPRRVARNSAAIDPAANDEKIV